MEKRLSECMFSMKQYLQVWKSSPFLAFLGVLVIQLANANCIKFQLQKKKKKWFTETRFALILHQIFTGSFSIGVGAIPWIIMSEVWN